MPYSNIHWIKLEKRLLNDYRFFLMSEKAQLYYIKLLLLCALTNNKVPRKYEVFKQLLRTECSEIELDKILDEIKLNFPKVLSHKDFYYVKGFKENHNWIAKKEILGNSEGTPDEGTDKIRIDKIRIDKIMEAFLDKKKYPKEKDDYNFYYKRFTNTIKRILFLAKGDITKVIGAIEWFGGLCDKKGLSWTLETIEKWLPEFLVKGKELKDIPKDFQGCLKGE